MGFLLSFNAGKQLQRENFKTKNNPKHSGYRPGSSATAMKNSTDKNKIWANQNKNLSALKENQDYDETGVASRAGDKRT